MRLSSTTLLIFHSAPARTRSISLRIPECPPDIKSNFARHVHCYGKIVNPHKYIQAGSPHNLSFLFHRQKLDQREYRLREWLLKELIDSSLDPLHKSGDSGSALHSSRNFPMNSSSIETFRMRNAAGPKAFSMFAPIARAFIVSASSLSGSSPSETKSI